MITPGSERGFGFVMTVALAVASVWPLFAGASPRYWGLFAALCIFTVSWLCPVWLKYPNILWFRFGMLLAQIVNPVVMAVVFFGVVTPIGGVLRVFGKQSMALYSDPEAETYWIARGERQPTKGSMQDQF